MRMWEMGFLMMLFCAGCRAEMTEEALSKVHFVKAAEEVGDRTQEERALMVKNRLGQIKDVIGTAVVVEGHTAIIGLRLEENMEQNREASVRKEADVLAKGADADIESTSVTTNTYIVALIEKMERQRAG